MAYLVYTPITFGWRAAAGPREDRSNLLQGQIEVWLRTGGGAPPLLKMYSSLTIIVMAAVAMDIIMSMIILLDIFEHLLLP